MLLLLIFVGLVWCLVLLEEETREPKWGSAGLFVLAGLAGLLVGLGALTRYSFGWLIVPVVLFAVFMSARQNLGLGLTAFLAFAAARSRGWHGITRLKGTPALELCL
jgi:4-amino-4-deoxy-L-arabinose transferase-like glycosyltransferase